MKRKTLLKRITSVTLASVMSLSVAMAPLPGGFFAVTAQAETPTGFELDADELKQGVNILPYALAENDGFLNSYVRKDGTTMSLNSSFETVSVNDISNAGKTLSRKTMGREKNGNGQWGAEFRLTLPEHVRNDNYDIRLEAKVKADYHYNIFYNAYKHWDPGYVEFYGVKRLLAAKANDEQWQAVSHTEGAGSWRYKSGIVTYCIGHEAPTECQCGSSAVTESTIYMWKKSEPYISDIYMTTDDAGKNKISGGLSFGDETEKKAYVVLEFNEDVRFSDNKGEKLTLNLNACYTKNGRSVDSNIVKGTLVSMTTRKMIFEVKVPNKIDKDNTDIYINGISDTQSFKGRSGGYELKIFNKDGKEFDAKDLISSSYITDLVGNPLNWGKSNKTFSKVYFDNVQPKVTEINMTGSMITDDSKGDKDSWDNGKDRSAVFAGVGDWVSFQLSFDEYVKGFSNGNVKAILSITDKKDNVTKTVKLGASQYRNNTIHFDQLEITETMKQAGARIEVVGFEGLGSVTDAYGNPLAKGSDYSADLKTITKSPSQGIYLDVDAPIVSTENDVTANNGVYQPYAFTEGEYFTFPLIVSEDVSNVKGLGDTSQIDTVPAQFSLVLEGEGKAYSWYVDTNKSVNKNAKTASAYTGSTEASATKNTYYPVDGKPSYVHIKLDEQTDYNYTETLGTNGGVYFTGSLYVYAKDHAGNQAVQSYALKHAVDTEAPKGNLAGKADLKVDYNAGKASLNTSFDVSDNYAIKSITYYWTDTTNSSNPVTKTPVTITMNPADGLTDNYASGNMAYEFTFDKNGDTGRKGSAKLNVAVEDYMGRTYEMESENFTYDFTRAVPMNFVETGSVEKPVLLPKVTILAPTSTGTDGGAQNTRTVLFIKTGENADGTNNYWGYDPRSSYTNDQGNFEINYTEDDLIADVMNGNWETGVEAPGFWFNVIGNIDVENRTSNFVGGSSGSVNSSDNIYVTGYDYPELQDFLKNYYGELEIICVTSQDFDMSKDKIYLKPASYNFNSATSQVEHYTVHLGNNASYETTVGAVKDANGQDAENLFAYESGKVPAQNIDNASITVYLKNVTAGEDAVNYNMALLDKENSKIELHYFGKDSTGYDRYSAGEVIYTWPVTGANEQTVVIPEGVAKEIGWYGIWVTTTNANGTATQTRLQKTFFMDPVVVEFNIDQYEKEYHYERIENPGTEEERRETEYLRVRSDSNLSEDADGVIEVAMGAAPNEYWRMNTSLTFTRTVRPFGTSGYVGTEFVKVRVYNKADAKFEEHAIWMDAYDGEEDVESFSYEPICVEEITKDSYGTKDAPKLPLYEGDNIICLELVNTNGVVVSKEELIYVTLPYEGVAIETKITKVSGKTGGIMEVEVTADLPADVEPLTEIQYGYNEDVTANSEYSILGSVPSVYSSKYFRESYTFRDDTAREFYVLDQNGNLYSEYVAIEDVDGEEPYISTDNNSYDLTSGNEVFNFFISAGDTDSTIDTDTLTLTFDKDYSAVLLGLTGDERTNNETQVTMKVPVNREKDEDGNYLPWESYSTTNNGIYKTLLHEEKTEKGGYFSLEVWGTWKHDAEVANGERDDPKNHVLTFYIEDGNGNSQTATRTYSYVNPYYSLGTGIALPEEEGGFDWYQPFYPDGTLGIYAMAPFSQINSYGAGTQQHAYYQWAGYDMFYTTAPMIQQDGYYTFQVIDLFGMNHELKLGVYAFEDLGIHIEFSETEETNEDVVVYATATLEGDYITEIYGTTESGKTIQGTISEEDPKTAQISMEENGSVTVRTFMDKERIAHVLNVDKVLEPVDVVYYTVEGADVSADMTEADDVIVAQVVCDEFLYGTNGALNYRFPRGSKKGASYTFEYTDAAGNTGSIKAVLPCDIKSLPGAEADETAPQLYASAYGQRNEKYKILATIDNPDGQELTGVFDCYNAQEYRLVLTVTDDSATKIVVTKPGEAAPTKYSAVTSGSTAEYVELKSNTITIKENTAFNVYVIDENNNVTALEGIVIEGIDRVAAEYMVEYEKGYDEDGHVVVIATFLPANAEDEMVPINVIDKSLPTRLVQTSVANPDYDPEDEYSDEEPYLYAERCYYVFKDNGAYNFRYRDEVGNMGEVLAQVQSMSTAAAVVETIQWLGIGAVAEPSQSQPVNKDVTADMNLTKAISEAALYVYDESAENGIGQSLSADAPVAVTFTGKSLQVTYTENVPYKIVVQFRASMNGRLGSYVLPEVTCIDKTAPAVTLQSAEMAENKRSMTLRFTTDEDTLLGEDYRAGYIKNHEILVTDSLEKELKFSDKAGNIAVYHVTENAAVDMSYLEVVYSTAGTDATVVTDAVNGLKLDVGESFYIKTNKAATVKLNNVEQGMAQANTWTKLTLPEEAGLHILQVIDNNTGDLVYDNVAAQPRDYVAPEIKLDSDSIVLFEGVSIETVLEKIHEGITITDDVDGAIEEYTLEGAPETAKIGTYSLTYKAQDKAGNKTNVYRTLYILKEGTPVLMANGEAALPYGRTVLSDKHVELQTIGIGTEGEELMIKWGSGMRTTAQMKHDVTIVEDMEFTVPENGFYTIYVRTQDRAEYVTYIQVEE